MLIASSGGGGSGSGSGSGSGLGINSSSGGLNLQGGNYCVNPLTLPTSISQVDTDAKALQIRTHGAAIEQFNEVEMFYYRDTSWKLFPAQPRTSESNHLKLTRTGREAAKLDFDFPNPNGLYTPKNKNSPWNYNAAKIYDPIFDEARKVCVRIGRNCYQNLVAGLTATVTPDITSGSLAGLTDGTLATLTDASLTANTVGTTTISGGQVDIAFDLGAKYAIKHSAIRFLYKSNATIIGKTLPYTVEMQWSNDNVTFYDHYIRPVCNNTNNTYPAGDYNLTLEGVIAEVLMTDLQLWARYVKFRIKFDTSLNLMIDEVAIYGGNYDSKLGCNMFVGYLGDSINTDVAGNVTGTAISTFKKLADNNENRLTALYTLTETSQIIRSLLTSASYWKSQNAYSSPLTSSEIGWASTDNLTSLNYPKWQSQTNSIEGYVRELAQSVGWTIYDDTNGIVQLLETPYQQLGFDKLFINDLDGNQNVRNCMRTRTGKNMRNTVEVSSGAVTIGSAGSITLFEPNSVARYGPRRVVITDPILSGAEFRQKAAQYVLRDYAWYLEELTAEINGDFDTRVNHIHAFRAPANPNLYASDSTFVGAIRDREYWKLLTMVDHFTVGNWRTEVTYSPYVPSAVLSPELTSLAPSSRIAIGGTAVSGVTVNWTPITDPHVVAVRFYISATSETSGFQRAGNGFNTSLTTVGTPSSGSYNQIEEIGDTTLLTVGGNYWMYITSVADDGSESIPSAVLKVTVGGTASDFSGWTVTDFSIGFVENSGPDAEGYYYYHVFCQWTSPSLGFKRMQIKYGFLTQPNTSSDTTGLRKETWPYGGDECEWHGDFIPSGLGWDRATAAELSWDIYFRTKTVFISGVDKLYGRMWTSSATSRWRKWGGDSDYEGWPGNVANTVFP